MYINHRGIDETWLCFCISIPWFSIRIYYLWPRTRLRAQSPTNTKYCWLWKSNSIAYVVVSIWSDFVAQESIMHWFLWRLCIIILLANFSVTVYIDNLCTSDLIWTLAEVRSRNDSLQPCQKWTNDCHIEGHI